MESISTSIWSFVFVVLVFTSQVIGQSSSLASSLSSLASGTSSMGSSSSGQPLGDSPLAALADEAAGGVLNVVNPCAIAAAVFGMPAAPYVIPCTILRRIRLFRENFLPQSTGVVPSRGLTEIIKNHKLLIGNFILSR